MKKTLKVLAVLVAIFAALCVPVMADSYNDTPTAFLGGVYTNDELVVAITNNAVLGLTAESIVLVPYGRANGYTNTVTIRTPYQRMGDANIRVCSGATNKVKIAAVSGLKSDWIGTVNGSIRIRAASVDCIVSDHLVPTLSFQTDYSTNRVGEISVLTNAVLAIP